MSGKRELPTFKVMGSAIRKSGYGSIEPEATVPRLGMNNVVELNQPKGTAHSVGARKQKSEEAHR
jgi:hypothetical protein